MEKRKRERIGGDGFTNVRQPGLERMGSYMRENTLCHVDVPSETYLGITCKAS